MQIKKVQKRIIVSLLLALGIPDGIPSAKAERFVETIPRNELLHDGCLHIFILGTGDPETEMQNIRKPACIAMVVNDKVFFFDAGEGAVQTAARLGLPYGHLSKVFMTHWHSDHFGGLGQLLNATWIHGRKQAVDVYGPHGTKQVLAGLKTAYRLDTKFRTETLHGILNPKLAGAIPHDARTTAKGTRVYSDGKLEISCFLVQHKPVVPAFGYTINYHGAKIVISGDTAVVASLEEQSKNADILISEAFSRPLIRKNLATTQAAEVAEDLSNYHADSLDLAKTAQRAGVKQLVLTHLVPAIATTDEAKSEFTEGMPQLFKSTLTVADDGDHIIVKPGKNAEFSIEYIHQKQPQIPVFPSPADEAPTG
ncbi:MAG: MBL fold metallo-hydrolase [Candidatus Obscuribacterales bacterium]|nr:MBL fold metallo-hydrolase [Candidatus Obscuribacterales bacterium]